MCYGKENNCGEDFQIKSMSKDPSIFFQSTKIRISFSFKFCSIFVQVFLTFMYWNVYILMMKP